MGSCEGVWLYKCSVVGLSYTVSGFVEYSELGRSRKMTSLQSLAPTKSTHHLSDYKSSHKPASNKNSHQRLSEILP